MRFLSLNGSTYSLQKVLLYICCVGVALAGACSYQLDKYQIDPTYIKCGIDSLTCSETQMCDLERQRCVPASPTIKFRLRLLMLPYSQANVRINDQICIDDQPCEVEVAPKSQATMTLAPDSNSQLLSLRNERDEPIVCTDSRCTFNLAQRDETLTATFANTTLCSSPEWCSMFQDVHLQSVWSPDGQRIVAVGDKGVILLSSDAGQSWSKRASVTTETLRGVSGNFDGHNMLAVGNKGTILRSNDAGATWYAQTSGTTQHLNAVWLSANGETAFAIGANGALLRSEGRRKRLPPLDITTGCAQALCSLSTPCSCQGSVFPKSISFKHLYTKKNRDVPALGASNVINLRIHS